MSVTNAATAKIEIDAGVRKCDQMAGKGIHKVKNYGGKRGLVIMFW